MLKEEIENLEKENKKIINKDIELVNIKIYEVDAFRIKAYLNVKMYDYLIDLDTLKCVFGNDKEKRDLEFEIYFENLRNFIKRSKISYSLST